MPLHLYPISNNLIEKFASHDNNCVTFLLTLVVFDRLQVCAYGINGIIRKKNLQNYWYLQHWDIAAIKYIIFFTGVSLRVSARRWRRDGTLRSRESGYTWGYRQYREGCIWKRGTFKENGTKGNLYIESEKDGWHDKRGFIVCDTHRTCWKQE